MATERYYHWLRLWRLDRVGGETDKHAKYRKPNGVVISVRKPQGLTSKQLMQELRLMAEQHGFDLPDDD